MIPLYGQNKAGDDLQNASDRDLAPAPITATKVVAKNTKRIALQHNSVAIAVTGMSGKALAGQLVAITNTSASGTAAHNVVLSDGTFDGTNNKATLNAPDESILVWFDKNGDGMVVVNSNGVAFASV